MKKNSRAALISLGMALLAFLFLLTGAGLLLIMAMGLGLGAICAGVVALGSIRKQPATRRGKGLAVTGICAGGFAMLLSPLVFVAVLARQWQHPPTPAWEKAMTANPPPNTPATNFTSNLPLVVLETAGQPISKNRATLARAKCYAVENGRASLDGKADYDGWATVHLRGFTSLRLPKRSYTFHTVDRNTNQINVPLLGLPKDEDWVLYAPFEDKTLMRDVLAYELANKMGHYAPRTRFVELFVKIAPGPLSQRDYAGVYVLVEKIKRGKNRVNIQKLEPAHHAEPELTGGYIVKRDHTEDQGGRFRTRRGGPYFYVYPKAENITPEQKAWLTAYFNTFEAALFGEDFQDPKRGYAAYLDVDSFIDIHWLVEASKNVDGFRYSTFLTKDRGGKLKLEPPWDWNRSFGNANYYDGGQPEKWYWPHLRPMEISWYGRLSQDPAFAQRCRARWFELRKDVLDPRNVLARVDELAAQLEEAQRRNFKRWPVLGQQVTCNYYVGHSFADEVRWMKDWIARRIAWIDRQLGAPPE